MIDTWDKLVKLPNVDYSILIRFNPPKRFTDWIWTSGHVYENTCIEVAVSSVMENGVEMTLRTSIVDVENLASSYYFDKAGKKIYIHMADGNAPNDEEDLIVVFVWINIADRIMMVDNAPTRPLVKADSLPILSVSVDDIIEGIYKFNFGSFSIINDGTWDKRSCDYYWTNSRIMIKVGGEDLPYSQYKTVFVGRIADFFVEDLVVSFTVKDIRVGTFDQLPINKYWQSNYGTYLNEEGETVSMLADGDEGKVIPITFGVKENVIPVCIDPTAGNGGKWKLQDGAMHEFTQIRKVKDTEIVLAPGVDYTEDLANGEFTLLCGLDKKSGGEELVCDIKGKDDEYGHLIINGSDIALYLLQNELIFVDDEIDFPSFVATVLIRTTELCLHLDTEQSSREIFQTLGRSIVSFFTPTQDGKLAFVAYESNITDDAIVLREEDYKSWQVNFNHSFLNDSVKVKYDKDPRTQTFKIVERTNEEVYSKYRIHSALELETYLKNKADAEVFCAGLLSLVSRPMIEVTTSVGGKAFPTYPTKKMILYRNRAADTDGYFDGKVFRIKRIDKDFGLGTTGLVLLDDLQSMGEEYCTVCYSCQDCYTEEESCTSCYACQLCNLNQASFCETCVNCENCDVCQVHYVVCETCLACNRCHTCQICNVGVVDCPICETHYSCSVCVITQTCPTCHTCNTCQECVSTQECVTCDACDVCEKCNTCEKCAFCEKCNTCEKCYSGV